MGLQRFFAALTAATLLIPMIIACGGPGFVSNAASRPPTGRSAPTQQRPYRVIALQTLGGTIGAGISITNRGWITGFSSKPGDSVFHAALWRDDGPPTDLGTLGGANSAVEWPNHDESGQVAGIAQTSTVDPLGEVWSCSAFIPYTGDTCLGFVWRNGAMNALATLGGNNGYAAGGNNHGQIAGWAENTTHDPTCTPPQVLQFEAVTWGSDGKARELPPLPGDPDGAATAINDQGTVAGISGICENAVGAQSAAHALVWQGGVAMNIGNLGGEGFNTPAAINDAGEVVGFSDLPGDGNGNNPNFHAFLWTRLGGIVDMGTLPGDVMSEGLGINDAGEIVGLSCPTTSCFPSRAFVWQNGVMTDLNSLIPSGSLYLIYANDIDNRGQITGLAYDQSTGAFLAFRAVPNGGAADARSFLKATPAVVPRMVLPEHLRVFGAFGRVVF